MLQTQSMHSNTFHAGAGDPEQLDETLVGGEERAPAPRYTSGSKVGRYVIVEEVGSGGMGVVFAAFDPQLNRKIALKILHPPGRDSAAAHEALRTRLLREAQAIAKLSHPNVIGVFDVGTIDDAVFVAMEFVEGCTLTKWLENDPSPTAIVEKFVGAGRGLAAAHLAGLVHRDFKPDNVLVGHDGQVRVSDFGLARTDPSLSAAVDDEPSVTGRLAVSRISETDVLSSPLTQAGAVVGTPRYMAPEQHAGAGTDARSDQFAFCVALYQALYKQEPFVAHTLERLAMAKQDGRICPIPSDSRAPIYLEPIVLRGLSPDPNDRFESMDALVNALVRDPSGRRRRFGLLGAAAVFIGFTAAAIGYHQAQTAGACDGSDERVRGVWDERRAEAVRRAMAATGADYAVQSFAEVERELDEYAQAWTAAHLEACRATHVHAEQSEVLLDLRMACLSRRIGALDALVGVLEHADAEVVERAVHAASSLPSIAPCSNPEFLLAPVEPPASDIEDAVAEVRASLTRAEALHAAGKYRDAAGLAEADRKRADELGYEPLQAEALYLTGSLLESLGRYEEAEAVLREAVETAVRGKHDEYAARAAIQLVAVVGDRLARYREGLQWEALARSFLDRLDLQGIERARLDVTAGNVLYRLGDLEQSRARYESAIARKEAESGADDPALAGWLINLGNVLHAQGAPNDAIAVFERAIALSEDALGIGHPVRAVAQASIGIVYHDLERYDDADRSLSASLPVLRRSMGETHPFVAAALTNLALVDEARGRHPSAIERFDQALAIYEEVVGVRHPDYARVLHNLGGVYQQLGRYDEARRHYQRAYAIRKEALSSEHLDLAVSFSGMADLDLVEGRFVDAEQGYERALAIYEAGGGDVRSVVETRFGLARAVAQRGQVERARELGQRAIDELGALQGRGRALQDELRSWLATLPATEP